MIKTQREHENSLRQAHRSAEERTKENVLFKVVVYEVEVLHDTSAITTKPSFSGPHYNVVDGRIEAVMP